MKKIIIPILLICAGAAASAEYRYPFHDYCLGEIPDLCYDTNADLTECLIANPDDLSYGCITAVRAYDRERWGWDRDIYDRWHDMGHDEKTAYKDANRPMMHEREHMRFGGGMRMHR